MRLPCDYLAFFALHKISRSRSITTIAVGDPTGASSDERHAAGKGAVRRLVVRDEAFSGLGLEQGREDAVPFGFAAAQAKIRLVTPQALHADVPPVVIFVGPSQDFARAHVPGANWVPRGWLEIHIGSLGPSFATLIAVTCNDGRQATLAGATLADLGYQTVTVLEGGKAAWLHAALPVERGLSGVMSPPMDVVPTAPNRLFADMMHYLRWEEALGTKYSS